MGKTRKDQRAQFDLCCVECDRLLERTPRGLACPRCGGLLSDEQAYAEQEYQEEDAA
jgi:hypothetical protein